MSNQKGSQDEVTEVFRTFYDDPTNKLCMDCNAEAREGWISVNNAISLCGPCAAQHSHFNEHISVVKNINAQGWEWKDLMLIRNGGNMKFKLFMDHYKLNLPNPLSKYKTKAAFFYRRKLRHLCEGKPEPKAPSHEEALEEVEHDNFLDKVADFFTGIFSSDKKDDIIEAHPGPLREETQAHGLLAPRIEESDGLKTDSFRPELQPKQGYEIPLEAPIQGTQLPLDNKMQGNYEKKDWMPSQPSKAETTSINKDIKLGEKELHKVENKELGQAKNAFENIRDKTSDKLHESLEKLKEGIHEGFHKLQSHKKENDLLKTDLPKERHIEPIHEEKTLEAPKQEIKAPEVTEAPKDIEVPKTTEASKETEAPKVTEAPIEEKEPELDIYRVLRHTKTREIIDHEQIMTWKHKKDEKELQSLAGEAAESVKARVMPSSNRSRQAQIAQQAAMLEAARGLTRLSKGAECDHEVILHGQVDFEYMERLENLGKDPKEIEKETTIEEVRKSEDFGVPEVFRANITRLASKVAEPTGDSAPQKIMSLKMKEKRDARLAKKKQRAAILAQQPDHTKLTQPPVDITLSPLEKKIKEKVLEGFSIQPLDNTMTQKSYDENGKPSPHTPKHSMEEGTNLIGKSLIKASTAHMEPLTHKMIRRKHFFKQIHKKEATQEEGAENKVEEIAKKISRKGDRKLSLAERFKEKVMGSFEMAKEKVTENLGLARENSGSLMDAAKEKLEAVKEKAAEKFEQVKDSAIMEATKEKFEHAKEKIEDAVGWIKDKFAPAAADGVKVAEPTEAAPTETQDLKPVGLTEEGEFAATKQAPPAESKELLKERVDF